MIPNSSIWLGRVEDTEAGAVKAISVELNCRRVHKIVGILLRIADIILYSCLIVNGKSV